MKLSVILPTFDEKENIVKLINEIVKIFAGTDHLFEIIVVDDNSPDGTGMACQKAFINNETIRVFTRRGERGFASAIYFGIRQAKGEYIIAMDSDFNHDPQVILKMLSQLSANRIVIASRYLKGGGMDNRKRYWLSKIYNAYLRALLGIDVTDILSCFFCINRKFLQKVAGQDKRLFRGYGDYFIRLVFWCHQMGGTFFEVPVYYKERQYGVSKSNLLKMFVLYTKTSLGLFLIRSLKGLQSLRRLF